MIAEAGGAFGEDRRPGLAFRLTPARRHDLNPSSLITGPTQGIGDRVRHASRCAGARVMLVDARRSAAFIRWLARCPATGHDAAFVRADGRADRHPSTRAVAATVARFGASHIRNNAFADPAVLAEETDLDLVIALTASPHA